MATAWMKMIYSYVYSKEITFNVQANSLQVICVVAFLVLYLVTSWEFVRGKQANAVIQTSMTSDKQGWNYIHTKIFTCTVTH
jgi:hypothetical protein